MPSLPKTPFFFKRTRVRVALALAALPLGMATAKVSSAVAEHYQLGLVEGLLASGAIGVTCGLAAIGFSYVVLIRRDDPSCG